jgi:hypothetical protein
LLPLLSPVAEGPRPTLLELGAGGGSLAFHFKPHFALTLTDRAPGILARSRAVNPECEHLVGDMTSLRLGRTFDRVLVHDAITYAVERAAVQATIATAVLHCRPGGVVVLVPDCVRETFEPGTVTGGHDGPEGRSLRFLEWTLDPDPDDERYESVFALLMREADGRLTSTHDHHHHGLFKREDWLTWMREAGCPARIHHDRWGRDVFIGVRPAPGP